MLNPTRIIIPSHHSHHLLTVIQEGLFGVFEDTKDLDISADLHPRLTSVQTTPDKRWLAELLWTSRPAQVYL
jgi:hypothetical protein